MPLYYQTADAGALLTRMEQLVRQGPGFPFSAWPSWPAGTPKAPTPAPAEHLIPKGFHLFRTDDPGEHQGGCVLLHVDGDPQQAFEQVKEIWNIPLRCQMLFDRVQPGADPRDLANELLALFTADLMDGSGDVLLSSARDRLSSPAVTVDLIYDEHAETLSISDDWETEAHVSFTVRCRFPVV